MENVAVVSQLGVVVGHAAELNESDGEQSYHPEQPRSRVVFAMIYAPSRVLRPSRPSLRDVSKESNRGFRRTGHRKMHHPAATARIDHERRDLISRNGIPQAAGIFDAPAEVLCRQLSVRKFIPESGWLLT
jgi:hypothetical protein